jgi:hypothetical protein
MSNKIYRYPAGIRITKAICKIVIPLFVTLTLYVWVTKSPNDFQSTTEYIILLITIPILPFFFFYFLYSWPDVGIQEEGLLVEFIIGFLYIPWEDLDDINYYGTLNFGAWLVKTKEKRLTVFHRLYGFIYGYSFQPGFLIHKQIESGKELINTIKSKGISINTGNLN